MTALSVVGSVLSGVARPSLGHGVGFSLPAFLAAMDDGFSFDFTKTDRHFQENIGPTLADNTGEVIGLALESREWNGRTLAEELAERTNLLTPGEWLMSVAGGTPTATESPDGTLNLTGDGTNNAIGDQSFATVVGRTYQIQSTANSNVVVRAGSTQGTSDALAAYTVTNTGAPVPLYFVAVSTTTWVRFSRSGASTVNVTGITAKLVPTHHGVQSSASLKGTRQVFYGYSDDQPELVTNGGFDSDLTNWNNPIVNRGVIAWGSGAITVTNDYTQGSSSGFTRAVQPIVTEVGKTYRLEATIISGAWTLRATETSDGGSVIIAQITGSGAQNTALVFTATGATTYVALLVNSASDAASASFDNVSVKEVPASRITTGCKFDGIDDNLLTTYRANVVADGPELVTNGEFATDTAGWTAAFQSSIAATGGRLRVTANGGTNPYTQAVISDLTIGRTYTVSANVYRGNSLSNSIEFGASPSATLSNVDYGFDFALSGDFAASFTFVASSSTLYLRARHANTTAGTYFEVDNVSVKEVTDQDNFIVAYVNVPTTISATQIIAGANDASSTNRWFIAFNTSGQLCGGVGGQSVSTILSTATDWRGKSVVVGISCDGATVRLFADDEIVYEAAQSGTPTTSTPLRIGSNNAAGTAASFTAATVGNVIAGPEYLDLATFLKIRNKLIDP